MPFPPLIEEMQPVNRPSVQWRNPVIHRRSTPIAIVSYNNARLHANESCDAHIVWVGWGLGVLGFHTWAKGSSKQWHFTTWCPSGLLASGALEVSEI